MGANDRLLLGAIALSSACRESNCISPHGTQFDAEQVAGDPNDRWDGSVLVFTDFVGVAIVGSRVGLAQFSTVGDSGAGESARWGGPLSLGLIGCASDTCGDPDTAAVPGGTYFAASREGEPVAFPGSTLTKSGDGVLEIVFLDGGAEQSVAYQVDPGSGVSFSSIPRAR